LKRITWRPTKPEQALNDALKKEGLEFEFQFPTRAGFVLDFAWPNVKLAVEVDGPTYRTKRGRRRDKFRDYRLRRAGWRVLRFTDREIRSNLKMVVNEIKENLSAPYRTRPDHTTEDKHNG